MDLEDKMSKMCTRCDNNKKPMLRINFNFFIIFNFEYIIAPSRISLFFPSSSTKRCTRSAAHSPR